MKAILFGIFVAFSAPISLAHAVSTAPCKKAASFAANRDRMLQQAALDSVRIYDRQPAKSIPPAQKRPDTRQ